MTWIVSTLFVDEEKTKLSHYSRAPHAIARLHG